METSATATTALAKTPELTRETVLDAIIDMAKALDSFDAHRRDFYITVPEGMTPHVEQAISDDEALAAFKKNSSYWPMQFPWCRKRHLGRVFMRPRSYYREYRPVFST